MGTDWSNFTPWASLTGDALIGVSTSLLIVTNGRIASISGLLGSLLQRGSEGWSEKSLSLLGLLLASLLWVRHVLRVGRALPWTGCSVAGNRCCCS